jgi:hypothetical protein
MLVKIQIAKRFDLLLKHLIEIKAEQKARKQEVKKQEVIVEQEVVSDEDSVTESFRSLSLNEELDDHNKYNDFGKVR